MARMIPPQVGPDTTSLGEREIFDCLRSDPKTNNWVVFHSLDIAEHTRQVSGEADFVIVIPGKGIICLEIKACSELRRHEGAWYYGAAPKPDFRGPFKQASQAMHSLRKKAVEYSPQLATIPFWSAVMFPYVDFSAHSPEWHSWQVIDKRKYKSRTIGSALLSIIENARLFLTKCPTAKWFDVRSSFPSKSQVDLIVAAFRGNFEFFESLRSRAQRRENELKHYTKEQFQALDSLSLNDRILFEGPAGTGKTVLALEAARRAVADGKRTLLVCFNKALARWLQAECSGLGANLMCGTIHGIMMKAARHKPDDIVCNSNYWKETLPSSAIDALIGAPSEEFSFDEIIVDEAQDLMMGKYIDFMDLCLKNGLDAGRWRFFADFERQTLYSCGEDYSAHRARISKRGTSCSLRQNCRNTPRIGGLARMLGGLDPDYAQFRRLDDGVEPRLTFYRDKYEQQDLLAVALGDLAAEGFSNRDIVVLSTLGDHASASSLLSKSSKWERLCPLHEDAPGRIRYSSIHAFKGLEAPVVIVTDVRHVEGEEAQALFYVAVTRPLQRLLLLIDEAAKNEILQVLRPMERT